MPNATFRCPRRRLTRRSCRLHSRSPGSPGKHPPLLMRCLRPRMRHLARLCASQAAPASSMPTSHSRLCRLVKAVHVLSMHEGCAKLIQGRWTSWARSKVQCQAEMQCLLPSTLPSCAHGIFSCQRPAMLGHCRVPSGWHSRWARVA